MEMEMRGGGGKEMEMEIETEMEMERGWIAGQRSGKHGGSGKRGPRRQRSRTARRVSPGRSCEEKP